jgi:tetratricopeptide (TPR) repeat protein
MRALLLGLAVLVATEAGPAAAVSRRPAFDDAELVSGSVLPFAGASVHVPTPEEVFALDEEMRAFVAPAAELRQPRQKLAALARALEARGMFSLDYAEVTRTAPATFRDRQGNCLSFTLLFVALARAAGLDASMQTVDVPPQWTYDGLVVIANHVNAVVRVGPGEVTIVDFNIRPYEAGQRRRRISDAHALGLFYSNLGAEAMLRDEYPAALVFFREAVRVHPDIADAWVNLGVLYSRHGFYEHAEAAYLRALEADAKDQSALGNLALVYETLGETELAAEYRERVQRYRERNPYYHYAKAARAYEDGRLEAALASLRKALRLKRDEHAFHVLRGEVLEAMGRAKEATQSFALAREYAEAAALRAQSRVAFQGPALR